MKKILPAIIIMAMLFTSCKKSADQTCATLPEDTSLQSRSVIDGLIKQKLESTGTFEWSSVNTNIIWSALEQSDHILSVGYRTSTSGDITNRLHTVNVQSQEWKNAKKQLLQQILDEERKSDKTLTMDQLVQWDDEVLPVFNVYVRNQSTVQMLRRSSLVRYAEPMGYEPEGVEERALSSSGCGSNVPETGLTEGVDYVTVAPNAKASWNYSYHKIQSAWSKSSGKGVKVFIIDTGCEFDQENLGTAFNQGNSSGRTIEKIVTLPRATFLGIPYGPTEIADDGCGHGTSMAGVCAAPQGIDGAACGIAYNANLITCRAAEDVFLDDSREVKGASDAFINAANRNDVKIISMSMGRMTSSSQLVDAIRYAYGKGKLIFCAAGTSFSFTTWFGVIFPATMTEVNAVTGVRDNNFSVSCSSCHDGSQTDFTIVMEKYANERHPLSLAMQGDAPSTVGGSSVSTASAAGIAALVWSRFPSYTRDQVLNKLITTSSNYPNRSSAHGWGLLNADAATN